MSLRSYCNHHISIQQNLGVDAGNGTVPPDWKAKHENVRCRFIPERFDVTDRFGARNAKTPAMFIIPDAAIAVQETDRIVYDGAPYRVLEIVNPHQANKFLQVHVERWE